jgi:YesN/AraC family two-component response regulator
LIKYIEKEKVFLKKDLTLYDVAKALNTNSSNISNVLNNMLNCNFVTFINSYRIDEAKKILISVNYSNYTIEAISEIVGFNSKSIETFSKNPVRCFM